MTVFYWFIESTRWLVLFNKIPQIRINCETKECSLNFVQAFLLSSLDFVEKCEQGNHFKIERSSVNSDKSINFNIVVIIGFLIEEILRISQITNL